MRNCFVLTLLIFAACNNAQQKEHTEANQQSKDTVSAVEEVTAAVSALLPVPNSYQVQLAKKWHDASGENWLVLYETGAYIEKGKMDPSAKLSAVLYKKTDSGFVQQWKMNDQILDCPLDITCSFYPNHLSITDLDQNGIAEITMLYALGCRGDVSPDQKKLIMYEGQQKYAIRGTELVMMPKDSLGGEMHPDPAFDKAPKAFLSFATDQWKKFGIRKYE